MKLARYRAVNASVTRVRRGCAARGLTSERQGSEENAERDTEDGDLSTEGSSREEEDRRD